MAALGQFGKLQPTNASVETPRPARCQPGDQRHGIGCPCDRAGAAFGEVVLHVDHDQR
jgi:hypothetical protein